MNKKSEINLVQADLDTVKKTHDKVREEMNLLEKALFFVHDKEAFNNVRNVIDFFQENLVKHFDFEEQRLFNVALTIGDIKIKQIVRKLQQEHIILLGKFDVIRDTVMKFGLSITNKEAKEAFVQLANEIMELLFQHARKEDEELMPFLAEKGVLDLTPDPDSTAASK